jgi:hypothetical protein
VSIKFLWNEGADAGKIAARLRAQFSEHAYQLRTAQFWTREIWRCHKYLYDEIRSARSPLDDLDGEILVILDESPFESAHSISERLRAVYSSVLHHLHESFGFKSFHLHWIPHQWTGDVWEKRKESARAILPLLDVAERDGWHHLVTDNESWFFFKISPCRMWTLSRGLGHEIET